MAAVDGRRDRTEVVDGTGDFDRGWVLRIEGAVDGVGDLGRKGPARDRSVAVDGAGDFGRGGLRTEGAVDGVGDFVRDGPAAALLVRAAGL